MYKIEKIYKMMDKNINMDMLVGDKVHLGHVSRIHNPLMEVYLYGRVNKIDIIDLDNTISMLRRGLRVVSEVTRNRGNVLFIGRGNDTSAIVGAAAKRCRQHYMSSSWVGGALTNWKEIFSSIEKLRIFERSNKSYKSYSPSEQRRYIRLKSLYNGMKNLNSLPDLLFIVGTNRNRMAIREANRLNIPTMGIVDSNGNPHGLTYPIPGNDDSMEAVYLYCNAVSNAAIEGFEMESLLFNELGV